MIYIKDEQALLEIAYSVWTWYAPATDEFENCAEQMYAQMLGWC